MFGPGSSLYECFTIEDLVTDYAELVAREPAASIGYWLGIQLSAEDAMGADSEMLRDIRNRIRPYWDIVDELPKTEQE